MPETGIVDYRAVGEKLCALVRRGGGEVLTGTRVVQLRDDGPRVIVATTTGEVAARGVVNCAGLHSDRVLEMGPALTPASESCLLPLVTKRKRPVGLRSTRERSARRTALAMLAILALPLVNATADSPGQTVLVAHEGLDEPFGVAFDTTGNVYIVEMGGNRVSVVGRDGKRWVLAGTGEKGLAAKRKRKKKTGSPRRTQSTQRKTETK